MCLDFLIKPEEEAAVNFISQYFAWFCNYAWINAALDRAALVHAGIKELWEVLALMKRQRQKSQVFHQMKVAN